MIKSSVQTFRMRTDVIECLDYIADTYGMNRSKVVNTFIMAGLRRAYGLGVNELSLKHLKDKGLAMPEGTAAQRQVISGALNGLHFDDVVAIGLRGEEDFQNDDRRN